MKILFVLKKNETYGFNNRLCRRSSGLWNSTRFIIEALRERGIDAKIVEVVDNNCIDREVSLFKPNKVVIEALWVVPEKFPVLMKLHPNVEWSVHLHSQMPFLALEGIAVEWLIEYARLGVKLIANSVNAYKALRTIFTKDALVYLPNVYGGKMHDPKHPRKGAFYLNVACFGAVRPLKNQLIQALAAIRFAEEIGTGLIFHVNGSRTETGGEPVLKNLRALFKDVRGGFHLEEHPWMEPERFEEVLRHKIDIGLQVSLTETFNVVTADYVSAGLPVVTSKEVKWVSCLSHAVDDSVGDIVKKMHRALRYRGLIDLNQWFLKRHARRARKAWFKFATE